MRKKVATATLYSLKDSEGGSTSTMQVPQLPPPPQFITLPCETARPLSVRLRHNPAKRSRAIYRGRAHVCGVELDLVLVHDVTEELLAAGRIRPVHREGAVGARLRLQSSTECRPKIRRPATRPTTPASSASEAGKGEAGLPRRTRARFAAWAAPAPARPGTRWVTRWNI